ncbi:MAG: ABC transporter ATP-binding protein [Flavobacteriales bacterium]|nr:ABC transporter ATP-binding protein [Flavobacteriales bacterium]
MSITDLVHHYNGVAQPAVNHLNLSIPKGAFYGLLGPNGAGKTTTISIICGILKPTSGNVSILGKDWKTDATAIKKSIGFVPQEIALYDTMTATENLNFFGQMLGLDRKAITKKADELMEAFGLAEHRTKQLENYSGGMKRRVNLMVALLHNPEILILDEPTVGIDVHSRHMINTYLKELNTNGMTIVYTSHQLDETEKLCDQVCIIDNGKLLIEGSTSELISDGNSLHHHFIELTGKQLRD